MKIVIVEDELDAREYLIRILRKHFAQCQIVAICDNVPDAVNAIREQLPDIVFLDVEIKLGTGFNVLEQVSDIPLSVVFTTAFDHYATAAFRHYAVDYLLKPLVEKQVADAVQRCIGRKALPDLAYQQHIYKLLEELRHPVSQKTKLGIHTMDGIEFVDIQDIIYGEASGSYTELWLRSGVKLTASRRLKEVEESLPPQQFFRIHHSYIVNLQYVKKYHKGRGGYLLLHNNVSLPVSSARKEAFLEWLG